MRVQDLCNDPLCDRIRRGEKHPAHDTSSIHQKKFESFQRWIVTGSDIAGAAIGAMAGGALGGPPGAIMALRQAL